MKLTRKALEAIAAPAAGYLLVWDTELRNFGCRITAGNTRAFFVQRRVRGRTVRKTIDRNDVLSPEAARNRARILLGDMGKGVDLVARDRELDQAQRQRAQAAARRDYVTFRKMLEAYTEYLEDAGKHATADVKSLFRKHVYDADPQLCARPAAAIGAGDITGLLRRLLSGPTKRGRRAAQLRSYLHAAFRLAAGAAYNADAPPTLSTFGVEHNPVAVVDPLRKYHRALTRTLSTAELREVLQRLAARNTQGAIALRFALYAGGQRPQQVLRLTLGDVDLEAGRAVLIDPKGRRAQPRLHEIYPGPVALALLEAQVERAHELGCKLIFSDTGETPVHICTVGQEITDICQAMMKEELTAQAFTARDLRRTAETMMAGIGIAPHIRAQLMSHGLSGVQVRNYDRHDYIAEKRAAALAWEQHLAKIRAIPGCGAAPWGAQQFGHHDQGIREHQQNERCDARGIVF